MQELINESKKVRPKLLEVSNIEISLGYRIGKNEPTSTEKKDGEPVIDFF